MNTGWKTWDKYLEKFRGKKVTVVELGVYLGDSTFWFLDNILTHPDSKIYSIDTFEGSPEYGIDFSVVKHKFIKKLEKHKSKSKVNLMPMYSFEALKILKDIKVDISYIDASHIASDVITDAVLMFPLMNVSGIMIFDDYLWEKISPSFYTPKPAIDAFMAIFKPYIDVLHIKRQVFLEKKAKEKYTPAIVTERQKMIDICDFMIDDVVRAEQSTLMEFVKPFPVTIEFEPAIPDTSDIFDSPNCVPYNYPEFEIDFKYEGHRMNIGHILYFTMIEKGLSTIKDKKMKYFHYSFIHKGNRNDYSYGVSIEKIYNLKHKDKYVELLLFHKGKRDEFWVDIFSDYKPLIPHFGKNDFVYFSMPIYGVTGFSREKINSIPVMLSIIFGILLCKPGGNILVHMLDCRTPANIEMIYLLKSYFATVRIEISGSCFNKCKISYFVYCFGLLRSGRDLEKHIKTLTKAQNIVHPDFTKNKIEKVIKSICKIDKTFANKLLDELGSSKTYIKNYLNIMNKICEFKDKALFIEIYKSRLLRLLK